MRFKAIYSVKNGNPSFNILYADSFFKLLNDKYNKGEDCIQEFIGELKAVKPSKTQEQLGYYYVAVIPAIKQALIEQGYYGLTDTDTHEWLKDRFYYKEVVNEQTQDIIKLPKSLSEASITEMSEYIDNCIRFAQEHLNIQIPEPNGINPRRSKSTIL